MYSLFFNDDVNPLFAVTSDPETHSPRRPCVCWLVITCLWLLCTGVTTATSSADESGVIVDLDGKQRTGLLKSWSLDALVLDSGSSIPLSTVRRISFDRPEKSVSGGDSIVWFSNGDRIMALAISIAQDELTIGWPVLTSEALTKIPLDQVAAMILHLPETLPQRLRLYADLETLPSGNDLVLLMNGDRSLGEIVRLGDAFVELKVGANLLKLDRSRVRAIRMDPALTSTAKTTKPRLAFLLNDGSQLTSTTVDLENNSLLLTSNALGSFQLPMRAVVSCQLFGQRVIPLADAVPSKVEITPYLSTNWPLVKNANVLRGPLMVRDRRYLTGLGMHSRTTATFELSGQEREFQAIVGIDDCAQGAGSVLFAVEVDGLLAWTSPELTGRSAPVNVPSVSLRGAKQLKLIVDFGQFADVSDYADWCDAVFILDPALGQGKKSDP